MLIDLARFLAVIAALEGGPCPPTAYGPYGISPGVLADVNARRGWAYTVRDLADPAVSAQVAGEHVRWLSSRIRAHAQAVTVVNLAACWRSGVRGWLAGKGRTYGGRAETLYHDPEDHWQ